MRWLPKLWDSFANKMIIQDVNSIQKTRDLREAWESIRASNPEFRSPFFSPTFSSALAKAGVGVEQAISIEAGEIVAILPFQRTSKRSARPPGVGLNDAHGLICQPSANLDIKGIMASVDLQEFEFHALPDQNAFRRFACRDVLSYRVNLRHQPGSYVDFLCERNRTIAKQGQKSRKLVRLQGPLRLEYDCRDTRLLETLMDWKSQQYRRTHLLDIFRIQWVRRLLMNLHQRQQGVRGQLSVLFAGSTPVAMHFGLREENWLHYWYPVYDPRFGFGSPGTELFLKIANASQEAGIDVIDFGYGHLPYKEVLCNETQAMKAGIVTFNPFRKWQYRTRKWTRNAVKRIWLKEPIKAAARTLLPNWDKKEFQ